eukprot:TRINITY_DN7_c0_g1_i2.p1 TRINITY_DN7_c0_g1~~TRINITY_DN7_c0_g1_i2.p1  ORF type:complete len:153 (+),score=22.09 TRINITY_DN7_c0_g1_i2:36-494(+)
MKAVFFALLSLLVIVQVSAQVAGSAADCEDYNGVDSIFWDWLLFPVAIDDIIGKLEKLEYKLHEINEKVPPFELIDPNGPINFHNQLEMNYHFANGENACLLNLASDVQAWLGALVNAIETQPDENCEEHPVAPENLIGLDSILNPPSHHWE